MSNTFIDLSQVAFSALSFLKRRATLLNTVWTDIVSGAVAANTGETVVVRTPPSFTTNTYNGSALTVQDITEGSVSVVLSSDEEVTVKWSPREEAASVAEVERLVIEPAMDALLRKVETDIESTFRAALITATREFGTAYGTDVEVKDLAAARKALNDQDVLQDDERYLWLSPKDGENLVQKTAFLDASASGRDTLSSGGLGRVFGFNVGESNAIVTNTTPTPDETYNLFYHRTACCVAMRALPEPSAPGVEFAVASNDGLTVNVTKQWDSASQSTIMVFRCLYGIKELDTNRGGVLKG